MKGDLSGLAGAGEPRTAPAREARRRAGRRRSRRPAFPVEFLSLGGIGPGVPVRATVSDFGPQLLAKVLGANETQEQSLALVFHYADEKGLPLLDLVGPARAAARSSSPTTARPSSRASAACRRPRSACCCARWCGSRTAAATSSSASRSSTINDLLRTGADGRGVISCLELPGGAGQAEAVLDGADVAAGRAVRGAARGRRPRQAEAGRSSSTRRTCCSTARPRRSWTRSRRRCG